MSRRRWSRVAAVLALCTLTTTVTGADLSLGILKEESGPKPSFGFIEKAMVDINADSSILPNDTLKLHVRSIFLPPPGSPPGALGVIQQTVLHAVNLSMHTIPTPVAVFGPVLDTHAEPAAFVFGSFGMPMYSTARSGVLANQASFPTFTRLAAPDSAVTKPMVSLCKSQSWKSVAVVFGDDVVGRGQADAFSATAAAHGIEVRTHSIPASNSVDDPKLDEDRNRAIDALLFSEDRIVFVLSFFTSRFLVLWHERGLHKKGRFQLIGNSAWPSIFVLQLRLTHLGRAPPGSFLHLPEAKYDALLAVMQGVVWVDELALGSSEKRREIDAYVKGGNQTTDTAPFAFNDYLRYDGVWVLAKAMHLIQSEGRVITHAEMLNATLFVEHDGITGSVVFDKEERTVLSGSRLLNFQSIDQPEVHVLTFSASTRAEELPEIQVDKGSIVWFDGTSNTPLDRVKPVVEWRRTPAWTQTVAVLLVVVGGAWLLTHTVGLLMYRNTPIFKAASPVLLWFVLLGALLGLIAILLVAADHDEYDGHARESTGILTFSRATIAIFCIWQPVLIGISFVMIFGVLATTAYRIAAILVQPNVPRAGKQIRKRIITDRTLLGAMLLLIAIEVAFDAIWASFSPLKLSAHSVAATNGLEKYEACSVSSASVAFAISFMFKLILFGVTVVKAVETRGVQSAFNESATVAVATYNIAVFCVVLVPLSIYAADNVAFAQPFRVFGLFLCVFSVLAILIGSKLYVARFRPQENRVHLVGSTAPAATSSAGLHHAGGGAGSTPINDRKKLAPATAGENMPVEQDRPSGVAEASPHGTVGRTTGKSQTTRQHVAARAPHAASVELA